MGDTGLAPDRPAVVLFIGVNGVGKTTTIGKLAAGLKAQGKRSCCAPEIPSAAAADQLTVLVPAGGVDIVKQHEGADPAAVVFDAVSAAKARGADVILVDTAGRLHNKQNLMNELSKISRVIDRELPGASRETLLVLDATTGQNGLIQAKQFRSPPGSPSPPLRVAIFYFFLRRFSHFHSTAKLFLRFFRLSFVLGNCHMEKLTHNR